MKRLFHFFFAALFASVMVAQVMAQEQKPFTAAELTKFVTDFPSFAKWSREKGDKIKAGGDWTALNFNNESEDQIKKLGWTQERFMYMIHHVFYGAAAAAAQGETGAVNAQLKAQKDQIMKSALTPEEKKNAIASLEAAMAQTAKIESGQGLDIPASEVELIKKELKRVQAMMDILKK